MSVTRVAFASTIALAVASAPSRRTPPGSIATDDPASNAQTASHTPNTSTPVMSSGVNGIAAARAAWERMEPRWSQSTALGAPVVPPV